MKEEPLGRAVSPSSTHWTLNSQISTLNFLRPIALALLLFHLDAPARTASVTLPENASPRVNFGTEKLKAALKQVRVDPVVVSPQPASQIHVELRISPNLAREEFRLHTPQPATPTTSSALILIEGGDDSGILYGSLELAKRIRDLGDLPQTLNETQRPALTLRGTCVGMQKTTILPGRKVYEYPYTPELFPWFYQKDLWLEYLDFLVENRFNSLYLWNGHPFSSLVRLPDYPDAIEVPEPVFRKNVEMFRWLTTECDKRGIWLVQMFYNIFLPLPLAEQHGDPTQLSAPTPLASDYTRKSIAEFVKQYPNVGLMVCLGEALQGTSNQVAWATQTILPGVHDGMRAARLASEPPVVIRTHAMDPEAIMPACFRVYSNLFTETKYNGESLTTYEPRGKAQATHLAMARLGPHMVNVHILSNLEPFRYGAQRFIKKSVLASRDRLGASGLHLYPLAYWNWPYSPDQCEPPLKQWDRDWIWFEAWARYAWNPDRPEDQDRAFWLARLSAFFDCDSETAGRILSGCNDAGEVAPILIRRFGITEGNRQTLSLGMTLDQLVNPKRYNAYSDLWESQAPPGERLDEFVLKESSMQPHSGETPVSAIAEVLRYASNAVAAFDSAAAGVNSRQDEFERWRRDALIIRHMAEFYAAKVEAARHVLLHKHEKNRPVAGRAALSPARRDVADAPQPSRAPEDTRPSLVGSAAVSAKPPYLELDTAVSAKPPYLPGHMDKAREAMIKSVSCFEEMTRLTAGAYHFANSMQTGHRKIPFPGAASGVSTNFHWTHVLPLYREELKQFEIQLADLNNPSTRQPEPVAPWPAAKFNLLSTNAEVYNVRVGAMPFADRRYAISELAPELSGLVGIRFSHEAAKNGKYEPIEFEVSEPVRVLVGYFQSDRDIWLQVPNLDVASHADERGGVDVVLRNAAAIQQCPNVNVHAFKYEPGRHKLELIGKGGFVVLGVVPQSIVLEKRDAGKGAL